MQSTSKPRCVNISPKEFLNLPNRPILIDVRMEIEYKTFRAPNARLVGMTDVLLGLRSKESRKNRWPQWLQDLTKKRDTPVAIICLAGQRSYLVGEQLAKAGFKEVYNIQGGMMEWCRLGLDVEKGEADAINAVVAAA
ncbi:rhodanese-like domain-containing protein [Leptothoe sp. EHU-05/26/07-4]